jgi:hypothetical protein
LMPGRFSNGGPGGQRRLTEEKHLTLSALRTLSQRVSAGPDLRSGDAPQARGRHLCVLRVSTVNPLNPLNPWSVIRETDLRSPLFVSV